jgi:hypothetical protein
MCALIYAGRRCTDRKAEVAMTVDNAAVRVHIDRAMAVNAGEPDFLRRLTRAFRLLQAERGIADTAQDEALAAAEHYLFARQAVAGNAVNLSQMLLMMSGDDAIGPSAERVGGCPRMRFRASQDVVGWGVAGALRGETDRETWLPGSLPPPFRPAFMRGDMPLAGRRACAGDTARC